ncbi:hypothetical protein EMPS_00066 [Entomortierella parvispora]|uniref:C2H2-type domain-containing protein n=1 Tax=Entomortierella parvispora TaxID=205924 RepID=A0A9P3LRM5_9FUNG|nr:hypothetical protein EMPS_00066 [Entomortierella parvispora]
MSYETTYFPPTPAMARDSFALNADPRNFYASVDETLTVDTTGAKQPQDRMRLKRILNNSNGSQEQIHGQDSCDGSSPHHHHQYYQDQASPAFQTFHSSATTGSVPVSTFPVSPVASLSPMTPSDGSPVPAGMAPTLATMTPFPGMNQSNLIFEEATMPYSYNMGSYNNGAAQAYSFNNKHAGHVRAMDQPEYGAESQQEYNGHHYNHNNTSSQSPDPSTGSSPTVLSSYPQQQQQQQQRAMTNSLVDHPYPVSGSPPSTFYGQHAHFQPSTGGSYSVGSQSPDFSNGYYNSAAAVAAVYGTDTFSPTPPTTPHYGFTYTMDGRYPGATGSVPMMYDHSNTGFTLQSQPPAPRTGSTSSKRSSAAAARAAARKNNPYEPRGSKSSDSMSIGSNGGVSAPAPTRRFQCHECEKAFPTKGELASHSRCHLKVPAFLCGICGRPFKRRTDYVRHVRNVHEEVGRYGCAQCGERFGRLDKLKRHDKRGCGNDDHDDDED